MYNKRSNSLILITISSLVILGNISITTIALLPVPVSASYHDLDSDNDGVINQDDNCPYIYNPIEEYPDDPWWKFWGARLAPAQDDHDRDGKGDPCDPDLIDSDGDNVPNS